MDKLLNELYQKDFDILLKLILDLKEKGWTKSQVRDLYSELLNKAIENGNQEQEDIIRGLLDRIEG